MIKSTGDSDAKQGATERLSVSEFKERVAALTDYQFDWFIERLSQEGILPTSERLIGPKPQS